MKSKIRYFSACLPDWPVFSDEHRPCVYFSSSLFPQPWLRAKDLTDAQYIFGKRTGRWTEEWMFSEWREMLGSLFLTNMSFRPWFYCPSWFPSLLISGHHTGEETGILSARPSWVWADHTIWALQWSVQITLASAKPLFCAHAIWLQATWNNVKTRIFWNQIKLFHVLALPPIIKVSEESTSLLWICFLIYKTGMIIHIYFIVL